MELTKTVICCAFVAMVIVDVMFAAPISVESSELAAVESRIVRDVESILTRDLQHLNRHRPRHNAVGRRRRHTMPHDFSLMEFCILKPHKCRQYIRRPRPRPSPRVVIIEK